MSMYMEYIYFIVYASIYVFSNGYSIKSLQ